jgi:hypothetical protein
MSSNEYNNNITSLSLDEINAMRQRITENLAEINTNKYKMKPNDFTTLMNYHKYILNTMNNMINVRTVEMNNAYGKRVGSNYQKGYYEKNNKMIVTNYDGTTSVVDTKDLKDSQEEWAAPFSQNLLVNAPTFIYPPQNVYTAPVKR